MPGSHFRIVSLHFHFSFGFVQVSPIWPCLAVCIFHLCVLTFSCTCFVQPSAICFCNLALQFLFSLSAYPSSSRAQSVFAEERHDKSDSNQNVSSLPPRYDTGALALAVVVVAVVVVVVVTVVVHICTYLLQHSVHLCALIFHAILYYFALKC